MTMPDFVREAILKQGKYDPAEIEDMLEPDVILGVIEPESEHQEVIDLELEDGTEAPGE